LSGIEVLLGSSGADNFILSPTNLSAHHHQWRYRLIPLLRRRAAGVFDFSGKTVNSIEVFKAPETPIPSLPAVRTSLPVSTAAQVADSITGSSVGETIYGGTGNDTLTGGSGADTFAFHNSGDGVDQITISQPTASLARLISLALILAVSPPSRQYRRSIL